MKFEHSTTTDHIQTKAYYKFRTW